MTAAPRWIAPLASAIAAGLFVGCQPSARSPRSGPIPVHRPPVHPVQAAASRSDTSPPEPPQNPTAPVAGEYASYLDASEEISCSQSFESSSWSGSWVLVLGEKGDATLRVATHYRSLSGPAELSDRYEPRHVASVFQQRTALWQGRAIRRAHVLELSLERKEPRCEVSNKAGAATGSPPTCGGANKTTLLCRVQYSRVRDSSRTDPGAAHLVSAELLHCAPAVGLPDHTPDAVSSRGLLFAPSPGVTITHHVWPGGQSVELALGKPEL